MSYSAAYEVESVVCDGQNRTAERLLYGELLTFNENVNNLVQQICKDLGVDKFNLPKDYVKKLMDNAELKKSLIEDMKILKLSDLSLQQATNLAALLMQIEIDFQEYTENIPTVGGVVKLAVIDKEGFRFISGDSVKKPKSL